MDEGLRFRREVGTFTDGYENRIRFNDDQTRMCLTIQCTNETYCVVYIVKLDIIEMFDHGKDVKE